MADIRSGTAKALSTRRSDATPTTNWRQTPTIWSIGASARVVSSDEANNAPADSF